MNQLGRVPSGHPRAIDGEVGHRQWAVVQHNTVGQIGDFDFNTSDKATDVSGDTDDLGFF